MTRQTWLPHRRDQVECGEAGVGDNDHAALRQPVLGLQDRLARPIGQLLVASPPSVAPALGRCQHRQERQRPTPAGPGDRDDNHQRQPPQAAGLDEVAVR